MLEKWVDTWMVGQKNQDMLEKWLEGGKVPYLEPDI